MNIRFTQPGHLNNPHELSVMLNAETIQVDFYNHMVAGGSPPAEAADIARRNAPALVIDLAKTVERQRADLGVLSLSADEDNMLLWAHYGDEHRGAIIELDAEQILISDPSPQAVQALLQVQYESSRVDFIARDLPLWMTVSFKSEPWAYEREWRLVRSLELLREKAPSIHVAEIPAAAIKRVVFGARADARAEEPIYNAAKTRPDLKHVVFEKAWFSSSLTKVERTPVEQFGWTILHGEHHFGDDWRLIRQWADLDAMQRSESADVAAAAQKAAREAESHAAKIRNPKA
ncbi:DUF2971 domain-containing protein [Brevundimonas sp.]|uniref:DUF2971 domain-containing protein n=1 Tax=Brevundimonas sp. TaxID=1871086 RepID=UPI00356623E4